MNFLPSDLTHDTFLSAIKNEKIVLIDFYAIWCEPCKYLDNILDVLEPKLRGIASIYKLDIDEQPELKKEFNIMSVPTLMIFTSGDLKWRMPGFMLLNELEEKILSFV